MDITKYFFMLCMLVASSGSAFSQTPANCTLVEPPADALRVPGPLDPKMTSAWFPKPGTPPENYTGCMSYWMGMNNLWLYQTEEEYENGELRRVSNITKSGATSCFYKDEILIEKSAAEAHCPQKPAGYLNMRK